MLRIPGATALALALMVLGQAAYAERVTPPPVPAEIEVDAGSVAFLVGHAIGTQNYLCLPSTTSDTGFGWTLFTPEATLFSDDGRQLSTHFFSPKPLEIDSFRPTWQHSRDTSSVWARLNTPTSDLLGLCLRRAGRDSLAPARGHRSRSRTQRGLRAGGRRPRSSG
jgi:hypothetical protein